MFDGAKKCPEMNSDSRLGIMPLQNLELGQLQQPLISAIFGQKFPGSREKNREFLPKAIQIFKFCPKFVNLA
jgi:hypothetical protein